MSNHRKTSPTSLLDLEAAASTPVRSIWQSPIAKPKPKKLERSFHYAKQDNSTKTCFPDKDEECSTDDEGEAFGTFEKDWAREDKKRNFQLDALESLEDCMEVTMQLADQIVRLISKLKKQIKPY